MSIERSPGRRHGEGRPGRAAPARRRRSPPGAVVHPLDDFCRRRIRRRQLDSGPVGASGWRGTARATSAAPPGATARSKARAPAACPCGIVHGGRRGQLPPAQEIDERPAVERGGAEGRRRRERHHLAPAVHPHPPVLPGHPPHRRRAARGAEELRRGVDLEGADRQHEAGRQRLAARVAQPVADDQDRPPRLAGGEGGDLEGEGRMAPGHRRDRQVALGQGLLRRDVGPGDEAASDADERLDREAPGERLDGAVLAEAAPRRRHRRRRPRSSRAARRRSSADSRPAGHRRRSPGTGSWPTPRRRAARPAPRRPRSPLGGSGRPAVGATAAGRWVQAETNPPRLALGQRQVIAVAVAGRHRAHRPPVRAVVGNLDVVSGGEVAAGPVDHQAAVLALLPEVDRQPWGGVAGRAPPGGGRVAVEGEGGSRPRRRRRGAGHRGAGVGVVRRQLAEGEAVDPHRAAAAPSDTGGDRQLDGADPPRLAAAGRPPGEGDLSLLDPHQAPVAGELVVAMVHPPDVLGAPPPPVPSAAGPAGATSLISRFSGGVSPRSQKLSSQLAGSSRSSGRRAAAQPAAAVEVEVEPQGAAVDPRRRPDLQRLTPSDGAARQALGSSQPSSTRPPASTVAILAGEVRRCREPHRNSARPPVGGVAPI